MQEAGLEKGLLQVYTGDGKGKSTAAFGLAVRAAGQGLKTVIIQFMKTGEYGENKTFLRLAPEVSVFAFGRPGFVHRRGARLEDRELAAQALAKARSVLETGGADLLILDELNNALYFGLLHLEEVLALLEARPPNVEVVLTGRNAPQELLERADLVTEMREIKHPYREGLRARRGIEY